MMSWLRWLLIPAAVAAPIGPVEYPAINGVTGALSYNPATGVFSQATCGNLSDEGTACNASMGTSGHTVPFLDGANTFSAQQSGNIATLTISGSTFTPTGTANHYSITLTAACPCTLANPSATPVAGTSGVIEVNQSAAGSNLISTWGSSYLAPGGTATITLSTGANAKDALAYWVEDSTHIWLFPSLNFVH
jgi:hypothetical protein